VRDTHGIDENNPLPFFAVKQRIEAALSAYAGRFVVVAVPNIANVLYGRDVGYTVERIVLDETTESISASHVRMLSAALKTTEQAPRAAAAAANGLNQERPSETPAARRHKFPSPHPIDSVAVACCLAISAPAHVSNINA
jgi:hypothetical protein